jgi:hypothetical protein
LDEGIVLFHLQKPVPLRPESSEPGVNVIVSRIAQHVMQCSWIGNATISRV